MEKSASFRLEQMYRTSKGESVRTKGPLPHPVNATCPRRYPAAPQDCSSMNARPPLVRTPIR